MSINYVQFHIGDFLSGVMHMDGAEVGAYTMMLMAHYQAGEKGLPDDDKKLRSICKITTRSWAKVKDTVLEKFYLENGYWKHERVLSELQKIADKKSQIAGPGRGNKTPKKQLGETLNDIQKTFKGNTKKNNPLKNNNLEKTEPITNNQIDTNVSIPPISPNEIDNDFEKLWTEWKPYDMPKGSKSDAKKKYATIRKREQDPNVILDGVRRYTALCHSSECKTKHVITWLNGNGCEEEHEEGQGNALRNTSTGNNSRPTRSEQARSVIEQTKREILERERAEVRHDNELCGTELRYLQ